MNNTVGTFYENAYEYIDPAFLKEHERYHPSCLHVTLRRNLREGKLTYDRDSLTYTCNETGVIIAVRKPPKHKARGRYAKISKG